MNRTVARHLPVLLSLLLVLAAVGTTVWLLGGADRPDTVLSSEDRAALGGPDIGRGDEPPEVGYPVPAEPDAVARVQIADVRVREQDLLSERVRQRAPPAPRGILRARRRRRT